MSNPNGTAEADWREKTTHAERYLYMLEHGILTDCTFVVGPEDGETKEFKVHRLQLASASAVFETMLTVEMSEAKTGHVRVTDLSLSTFQLLLRFIYTGKSENVATFEEAQDVAFAAHKYLMKQLLASAVDDLCSLLTPENVWTALDYAKLLEQSQLHDACIEVLRVDTELLFTCENFTQISEDHLALLLQQDKLNVEDEMDLVNVAVFWARHEARRRGLSDDDEGVRAVLEPRLLPLLRFLALKPHQFVTGPGVAGWLTSEEKAAITESLRTTDCSLLPSYLSTAQNRKKSLDKLEVNGMYEKVQLIVRKSEENQSRPNLFAQNIGPTVRIACQNFNNGVRAKLVFRVKSQCKLLGFECLSRYRAADPTVISPPVYLENIVALLYQLNSSLSTQLKSDEVSRKEIYELITAYNSSTRIMFDKPIVISPQRWFAIEVKLMVDRNDPQAMSLIQYENPTRALNVRSAGVEFVFHTKEQEGFQTSLNDGLIQSLFFLKM